MCTTAIKNFLMLIETIAISILLGLEMFNQGDNIHKFVEEPVIILFYIAVVIGMFSHVFQHIHCSIDRVQSPTIYKLIKWLKTLLILGSRIVFEVVIVWTVINANQRRNKERTVDFGYLLGTINVIIILLTLIEALFMQKDNILRHQKVE